MADTINIADKLAGEDLTAGEFNQLKNKTNAAITEQNETKTSHAASIAANAAAITAEAEARASADAGKVDKVTGKGLSTEDFTTVEKQKLAGISPSANNYTHPESHPASMITETESLKVMTAAERAKLAGIPAGGGGSAGSPTGELVEWVTGQTKPTVEADRFIGDFVEGKNHLVTTIAVGEETVAVIQVENFDVASLMTLSGSVLKIIVEDSGSILIAGDFICPGHESNYSLMRLTADGAIDETFFHDFNFTDEKLIRGIVKQADGKILVSSDYEPIVRLNSDGSVDETFSCELISNHVFPLSDGSILVVGGTTTLTKITSAGVVDASFPVINGSTAYCACKISGKILIGILEAPYIVCYNDDGTVDTGFTAPMLDNVMETIVQLADGSIILAGGFTGLLKKISTAGVVDSNFTYTSELAMNIRVITQKGTNILAGGDAGTNYDSLIEIDMTGTIVNANVVQFGISANAVVFDANGKMLVGGEDYWQRGIIRYTTGFDVDPYFGYITKRISYLQSIVERLDAIEAAIAPQE